MRNNTLTACILINVVISAILIQGYITGQFDPTVRSVVISEVKVILLALGWFVTVI